MPVQLKSWKYKEVDKGGLEDWKVRAEERNKWERH